MNRQFSPSLWHQAPAGQCGPATIAASSNGQVLRSRFGWVTDPRSMASISPPASAPGLLLDWRPPTPMKKHMIPKVVDACVSGRFISEVRLKKLRCFRSGMGHRFVPYRTMQKTPAKSGRVRMNANPGSTGSQPFGPQFDPTVPSLPSCPFRHILPPLTPNP